MKLYFDDVHNETIINLSDFDIKLNSFSNTSIKKYPLGQLLIDFTELDFLKLFDLAENQLVLPLPNNDKDVINHIQKVKDFFIELINIHPYFISLNDTISELIMEYKSITNNYLRNNSFDKSIENSLKLHFYDIIHEITSMQETSYKHHIAIEFVLDKGFAIELKNLSYLQRYYLFTVINKDFEIGIQNIPIQYTYKLNTTYDIVNMDFEYDNPDAINLNSLTQYLPKEPLRLYQVFDVNIDSACHLELIKLISSDTIIRRCLNCERYFIVTGRSDTKYCTRSVDNNGKSCKDVGAINLYKDKIKNDPITQAYNKAYRRNNSRVRYKKMSKEEFALWSGEARELRDKTLAGEMTLKEFEIWLNQ